MGASPAKRFVAGTRRNHGEEGSVPMESFSSSMSQGRPIQAAVGPVSLPVASLSWFPWPSTWPVFTCLP